MIFLFIYVLIGIFFAGYLKEDEPGWMAIIALLWPILMITIAVILITSTVYDLGQKIFDYMKEKNNESI